MHVRAELNTHEINSSDDLSWKHRMASGESRPVDAGVSFHGDEAKFYWLYKGEMYAIRMSREMFDRLSHKPEQVVPIIKEVGK